MQAPIVKTPLSIIALFVALIELFLAYPVTRVSGAERLIIVIFMATFPFFVALSFFYILWHKPENLYSPGEKAEASALERRVAAELKLEELEDENRRLRERAVPADAAVFAPTVAQELAEGAGKTPSAEVEDLEAAVRSQISSAGTAGPAEVRDVKNQVRRARQRSKEQKAEAVRREMENFRRWLGGIGIEDLPPLPEIVIEPADMVNAYYVDGTAHFGELLAEHPEVIGHTYIHVVLLARPALSVFEGETAALTEGYCDYYGCSYVGHPYVGRGIGKSLGLSTDWLRNLEEVIPLTGAPNEPHAMGVVWAGALWELRQSFGQAPVDLAAWKTVLQLGARATMSEAALALRGELLSAVGDEAAVKTTEVFGKREVVLPPFGAVAARDSRSRPRPPGSRSTRSKATPGSRRPTKT